jgi:hypothetical protein
MQSENDVPRFLRLGDLQERGIAMTHQAVRHMQKNQGFPPGRLLGLAVCKRYWVCIYYRYAQQKQQERYLPEPWHR